MKRIILVICILLTIVFTNGVNANIICNDGTASETCMDCHKGCCSRHGGCTPGGPTTEDKTTKTIKTTVSRTTTRLTTTVAPTTTKSTSTTTSTTTSNTTTTIITSPSSETTTTRYITAKTDDEAKFDDFESNDDGYAAIGGIILLSLLGGGGYAGYKVVDKIKNG